MIPALDEPPGAMVIPALDEPPGAMVIRALDETSGSAGAQDQVEIERWAGLAAAVLRSEGVAGGELGLSFVDPDAMAELNLAHMGVPGPTDVLAFPIDGANGRGAPAPGPAVLLGDVVVCPAYAARHTTGANTAEPDNGPTSGSLAVPDNGPTSGSLDDELALLVVHGVLHVLGYDHALAEEAAVMRARERRLLAAHHRQS